MNSLESFPKSASESNESERSQEEQHKEFKEGLQQWFEDPWGVNSKEIPDVLEGRPSKERLVEDQARLRLCWDTIADSGKSLTELLEDRSYTDDLVVVGTFIKDKGKEMASDTIDPFTAAGTILKVLAESKSLLEPPIPRPTIDRRLQYGFDQYQKDPRAWETVYRELGSVLYTLNDVLPDTLKELLEVSAYEMNQRVLAVAQDQQALLEHLKSENIRTRRAFMTSLFLTGAGLPIVGWLGKMTGQQKGRQESIAALLEDKTEKLSEAYVDFIETADSVQLSDKEKKEVTEEVFFVVKQFSPNMIDGLIAAHEQASDRKRETDDSWDLEISGFSEATNGRITDARLAGLVEGGDYFPAAWAGSHVRKIEGRAEDNTLAESRGLKGLTAGEANSEEGSVRLFITSRKRQLLAAGKMPASRLAADLSETLGHELAHMNDWDSLNPHLTARSRLRFLYEVTQSFLARYKEQETGPGGGDWTYPDRTTKENVFEERLAKVTEWWAVMCEDYFEKPQLLSAVRKDLYVTVHKWVTQTNGGKSFDPRVARQNRSDLFSALDAGF